MSDADRWAVVERIYHEAVERPVADRPAFLASACAGDVALRRELDSLLATDGASLLDKSALDVAAREMTPQITVSWVGRAIRHYEVVALIGVGGMGEVYRARDRSLGREVALKLLPQEVSKDPERLRRLEREARILASLNHAGIATLFGLEEHDGQRFLVMELVPGQTLAERLRHGALPIRDALDIGRQIAEGLEAAHDAGVVHRDLKPSNVKVTPDGRVKLLDFGLAKAVDPTPGGVDPTLTASEATREGTVLGTPAYMSPEQARGQPVDRRTDIWAFGCCLYECLTGARAFRGGTVTDTLAAVLNTEPDWAALHEDVPVVARRLLRRCLAKDARHRLQHIGDARVELEDIGLDATEPSAHPRWSSRTISALLIVVAATVAATALLLWPSPAATRAPLIRFDLIVPPGIRVEDYHPGAISPDGRHFAVSALVNGRQQLVLRHLESSALVPLTGTEGGFAPFWSPDSQSIGFFNFDGYLRQVRLTGGPVRRLADASTDGPDFGGTWRGGVILFGSHKGRIYRVAPTGGTASTLQTLPVASGEKPFSSPRFLPDGRHFLVSVVGDPALYLASLDTSGTRKLMEDGASAVYAAGHLFYSRGTQILARPFDAQRLEFSGAEVQVTEGTRDISVSDDGTIVYRATGAMMSRLTWFDRSGQRTGTVGEPGPYEQLVLSPRGRHAAVERPDDQGFSDLWDVDLVSNIFSRLTTDPADDSNPSWSPDERALAFSSTRTGRSAVFVKDLVSGKEDPLVALDERVALDQWTPDGRFVVFRTYGKAVYAAPLSGEHTPRLLVDTPFTEDEVHVSPDGRWVAFNANESGRWEVYVAAFPAFTSKRQISSGGGVQPQWRADGRELFYLAPDSAMMSVRMDTRAGLTASPPARLFATNIVPGPDVPKYGVTTDGQRFLGIEPVAGGTSFTFLFNWLNAKAATGGDPVR